MSHYHSAQLIRISLATTALTCGGLAQAQVSQRLDGGELQPQIVAEIPGSAERVFFEYLRRPEVTARSFANVAINGCSGTMIGPNILLTAAHCRVEFFTSAAFRAYVGANEQRVESFRCQYLIHGWPETDIALAWCDPGADGVNPGDRWGYLDLDVDITPARQVGEGNSRQRVRTGMPVYSIWQNPIETLGPGGHMLYSAGTITNTTTSIWSNPGGAPCSNADDDLVGVTTDAYGAPGVSGSTHISSNTHRVLLASTTSAPASGGFSRTTGSVIDQLTKYSLTTDNTTGACANRTGPQVNDAQLRFLWNRGIRFDADINNFTKYYNRSLDADRNGVFDVMQDLEASAGEQRRTFYNLRFESPRRTLLWERSPSSVILSSAFFGWVDQPLASTEWRTVLSHNRLNLDPNKTYWLRYRVKANNPATLVASIGATSSTRMLNAGETKTFVESGTGGRVSFAATGAGNLLINDISISEVGTEINFDMYDQRKVWKRTPAQPPIDQLTAAESAAYIIPHARLSSSVDWAGVVSRDSASIFPSHYPLVSHAVATPPGYVRVCFDHRLLSGPQPAPGGRLLLGGISGGNFDFALSATWQRSCTRWMGGPSSNGGAIQQLLSLEFQLPFVPKLTSYRYLVDNISVMHATSLPTP
jgi:hypothetical protein